MGCSASHDMHEKQEIVKQQEQQKLQHFHERYTLAQEIGDGAFAQVWLAYCNDSGSECAVKILGLTKNGEECNSLRREFRSEQRIWREVGENENIVHLQESFNDHLFGYFVMERCTSSLLDSLRAAPALNELVYVDIFLQMVLALGYIHSMQVVHRDVKQDNFLVGGPGGRTVKLCDFGLSALLPADGLISGTYGTAPYMSPEMVAKELRHGMPADMWSLGVIMYSLFFGCFPYNPPREKTSETMKNAIREGDVLPTFKPSKKFAHLSQEPVSESAMAVVVSLLRRDPAARPSASKLLRMPYFADASQSSDTTKLVSLMPMLHGAIRCGAFQARGPRRVAKTYDALLDLQARANPNGSKLKAFQEGGSKGYWNTTTSNASTDTADDELRRTPASSKSSHFS